MKFSMNGKSLQMSGYCGHSKKGKYFNIEVCSQHQEPTNFYINGLEEFEEFISGVNEMLSQYKHVPEYFLPRHECAHDGAREEKEQMASNGVKMISVKCAVCGIHIEWKKQWTEETLKTHELVMPFGQYKGMTVSEIVEKYPGYSKWASENLDKEKLKTAFRKALNNAPQN